MCFLGLDAPDIDIAKLTAHACLQVLFKFSTDEIKSEIVALRLRRVDSAMDNESFTQRMNGLKEVGLSLIVA
jgi:hypothetical protein